MNELETITHDLITTYRKRLYSPFTKAIRDYGLIDPNDRIAVCISGGKDSFLVALLLRELQAHGPIPFELEYICLDPGYSQETLEQIKENAQRLGIELKYFQATIFRYLDTLKNKPCYICARMRRGNLYNAAKTLGCNKIALGHHYDDIVETILMSTLYAGNFKTMLPMVASAHFEGMSLIRPLYLVEEKHIRTFWEREKFQFIQCACNLTKRENDSKRAEIKELIAQMEKVNPIVKKNIFKSAMEVQTETVLSYLDKEGLHKNFNSHDDREDQ